MLTSSDGKITMKLYNGSDMLVSNIENDNYFNTNMVISGANLISNLNKNGEEIKGQLTVESYNID